MKEDWPVTGGDDRDSGRFGEPAAPAPDQLAGWQDRLGGSPFAAPDRAGLAPRRAAAPDHTWSPEPARRADAAELIDGEMGGSPWAAPTPEPIDPPTPQLSAPAAPSWSVPEGSTTQWTEGSGSAAAPWGPGGSDAGTRAAWDDLWRASPQQGVAALDPAPPAAGPSPAVPDSAAASQPQPAWPTPIGSTTFGPPGDYSGPGQGALADPENGVGVYHRDGFGRQQLGNVHPQRVVPTAGYEPPSRAFIPVEHHGYPPPIPPKRRTGITVAYSVVGLLVAAMVAGLVLPALVQLPLFASVQSQEPSPSPAKASPAATAGGATSGSSATSSTPSSSSTSKATTPSSPVKVLTKNPLYTLTVPAKCPDQSIPSSSSAFRAQVKGLVACMNKAWSKALAKTDVEFSKPKVKFYKSSIQTACSTLGSSFPAAYCTGDNTLYFSSSAYKQGGYYRLAVAQFVMHEYGHHVQWLTGIFSNSKALDESSSKTSRRIELQAHCMAHYQLTRSKVDFDGMDRVDVEYQFDYTNDPTGHGSTKAERYWGERGLDGKSMKACNTWKVPAAKVK